MIIKGGTGRSLAATRLQRAWRKRKANKKFVRKVQSASLKKDPVQYRLFGRYPGTACSQAPAIVQNVSNLFSKQDVSNPRFYRTSMKIKAMNYHAHIRVNFQDTTNQVCLALLRHKRSGPIVTADIQGGVPATPVIDSEDKPFMNMDAPNSFAGNMTGIALDASPKALLEIFNPKVVDVLKTYTVNVQNPSATQGAFFKPYVDLEYNHKFNEVWKYPESATPGVQTSPFPYNNKCYQWVAWSDSVTASSHPTVVIQNRLSFKDLD